MHYRSIDLTQWIGAIKRAHTPRWHDDQVAYSQASGIWGGGANPHGVFLNYESEVLLERAKPWKATAYLARSPNGMWAIGCTYSSSINGGGYAPSIWHETAFPSREDARRAAALALANSFQMLVTGPDCSQKVRSEARLFVGILMSIAEPEPKQLTLF